MLRVVPPPAGWRLPLIPIRAASVIDGEPVTWPVRELGAVAIVFFDHRMQKRVVVASKLSPAHLYNASTGVWTASSIVAIAQAAMPYLDFVHKNSQRPWGKRTEYGFEKHAFAPKTVNMGMYGVRDAFKTKFFNARLCLFNQTAFREKIKGRVAQLCPLPCPQKSLPVLSKGAVDADGRIDFALAQHLPTLRKLVAARQCVVRLGSIIVHALNEDTKIKVIGELVWWQHYEPYRRAMQNAASEHAATPQKRLRHVPDECIAEARALASRIKRAKKAGDQTAAKQCAAILPKCMLRANHLFTNRQRLELSAVLHKAGASISRELVLKLAGNHAVRAREFEGIVKHDATSAKKIHVPLCDRKCAKGECPFGGNTAACAADIRARSNAVPVAPPADIEDVLKATPNDTFATPANAVTYGMTLRARGRT